MTTNIILSTRNKVKAAQIKTLLGDVPVSILTLEEAGVEGEGIEDGATIEENATKKALYAWEQTKGWCMADDSGIFIDALGGAPGVISARWAGEGRSTEEIMQYTLKKLEGVSPERRTATFRCCAVVVSPAKEIMTFIGESPGSILLEPRVPPQSQMPYSSIFLPDGSDRTAAEMTHEESNTISHRGKAFRQVCNFLQRTF